MSRPFYRVAKIIYLVGLTLLTCYFIFPFAIAIFFAATLALAMYPLQLKLENKGFGRKKSAALLTIIFAVIISIPLFFFISKGTFAVTKQLEKISESEKFKGQGVQEIVSDMREDIIQYVQKYAVKFNVEDLLNTTKISGHLNTVNNYLLVFFRDIISGLPVMFLLFLVMIVCTYSFLKNSQNVRRFFQAIFGFNDSRMDQLVQVFINNSRQVYVTNIVTGSIQSLIVATSVAILRLGDFFLVFFITLILSFIPVIGAAPVAFAFAIVAFLKGLTTTGIILVVVGSFTGVIDNILRPWLATLGESKIPPIGAFVCVIGGAILLGFPGLFMGLLIGSIAYDTLPIFWDELQKGK